MNRTVPLVLALSSIGCAGEPARVAALSTPPSPIVTATPPAPRSDLPPPLFEGLGPHKRKITTTSAEAQRYVDQGLALMASITTRPSAPSATPPSSIRCV